MSYELVKNITKKKDGKVFITSASNNWWPRDYSRWEFMPSDKYEKEKVENKMLYLFHGIIGGSYQFNETVSENWKYALNKFREYCKENNLSTSDIWDSVYENNEYNIEKLKPYYDKFNEFYEEKIEGKYYLSSSNGAVTKINKKSFYTNPYGVNGAIGDYKKIYNNLHKLSNDSIQRYNISIKEYTLNKDLDSVIQTNKDVTMEI